MSKNIEQLYKEKFENFEAPVSDTLWDKIQENPTWQQHLRRQKVRNMAIYASLAIVSVGTCIALIFHQPADETTDLTDDGILTTENSLPISETVVTENIAPQEQIVEMATENPVQELESNSAAAVETIIVNEQTEANDNTSNDSDIHPETQTNTNNPVKAETPSGNDKSKPENNQAQETKTTKSNDNHPTDPPTPAPVDNTPTNKSLFSIPNAFTPNGDGTNEIFMPLTAAEITNYQLDIFTLNGQHIFTSRNIDYGWNGEFQGNPANKGTYIYVIKYKDATGKEHIDKGQLLLMR